MAQELQPDMSEELPVRTSSGEFSLIHLLSIGLSFYLVYPIVASLFYLAGIANEQGIGAAGTLFGQMLFGYLLTWPFRIAAIILLLKRKKAGWLLAFTFFVAQAVFVNISVFLWNYGNGLPRGISGFILHLTQYHSHLVYISLLAAILMGWKKYREFFGITWQNVAVYTAIGIIWGIILAIITDVRDTNLTGTF